MQPRPQLMGPCSVLREIRNPLNWHALSGAAPPAKLLRRYTLPLLSCWILLHSAGAAQSPANRPPFSREGIRIPERKRSPGVKGSTEWGWLSGTAVSIAGGVRQGNFWTAYLRWGRIVTAPHGPRFLRGNLEYAVELVPLMLIRQPSTVIGEGLNPLVLQYNFTSNPKWNPFVQVGGGVLLTSEKVPPQTSQFNFTPQGGVGMYWNGWHEATVSFGVRYHHISNASTAPRNPGRNSLLFYTGISWWR
ncbi:MAG: acyloxyacyl hydrolase [Acidobacteria bacterium]|nr:acyloxyacyl hydrolase [Acidobacteriota bacterium]